MVSACGLCLRGNSLQIPGVVKSSDAKSSDKGYAGRYRQHPKRQWKQKTKGKKKERSSNPWVLAYKMGVC